MTERPEAFYPSPTPLAVQVNWKVPTEFPACPEEFTDDGLMHYASRLKFGGIFAQNHLSTSLIVHFRLRDDDLIVLTRFAGEPIKDWAVTCISTREGHFLHRSEFTFFELQGALKHFCKLSGEQFEESIDDYS